jgi:hypothetical protein
MNIGGDIKKKEEGGKWDGWMDDRAEQSRADEVR